MIKSKNSKLLISILLAIVMMVSGVVLCSCSMSLKAIVSAGYSINSIIYTDDYQKYIEGRTIIDQIEFAFEGQSSTQTLESGEESGMWVLETDKTKVVDVVFTTVSTGEGNTDHSVGYSPEYVLEVEKYYNKEVLIMDNSHIFSGIINWYAAYGGCECGKWDSIDGNCPCGSPPSGSWDTDEKKNDSEVMEHFGVACKICCKVVETDNGDGTYTYTVQRDCKCKWAHNGTWELVNNNWIKDSGLSPFTEYKLSGVVSFDELIIDGYDFGELYNQVKNQDFTGYSNWEQYYNLNDFSHMFSDLPVKKITIKNATGLDENALDLSSMFENCTNLETIEFGNLFDNCKPTNINRMFYNCPKLKNIDLTSLDTSNVTNMSNMFALGGMSADLEERDAILEDYINNVIVPEDDELNDGTIYTVESFAEKCEVSKELLYVGGAMGLGYPVSYSELTIAMYDMNFTECCIAIKNGDITIEGTTFDSIADMIDYLKTQASEYGINAVYDADFYAKTDRDTYINYVINNLIVPYTNIEVGEEPYTLDTLAEKLGYSKEKTLVEIVIETGLDIPVTYNEICEHAFDMSIDELVSAVNADPTEFGLEAKEAQYTEEELIEIFNPYILSEYGFEAIMEDEIASYYNPEIDITRKLILGGSDSKFVIKNGTDISNLFGDSCEFGIVIAPNEIGDSIELILNRVYSSNDVDMVTKITADDTSKTFTYQREIEIPKDPDPEPEDPIEDVTPNVPNGGDEENNDKENDDKENNLATIIIIASGSVVLFGGVSTSLIIVIKKKKKPMTIKGQHL